MLGLALSFCSASALAQKITTNWNGTEASWFSGAWTGGVPNSFTDFTRIDNAGTVQITSGMATAQLVYLGSTVDTSGTLEVMNGGSANFTSVVVGGLIGTGVLRVLNGGTLTSFGGPVGSDYLGVGLAVIDGSTSSWTLISSDTVIGSNGIGTIQVQNGGRFTVGGGSGRIELGHHPVSSGTLQIGNGGTAGIVNASEIYNGEGTATLIFNHTESNYLFAPKISGFGTVAGGFTIRHDGPGTTILTAATNEMAGPTIVSNGRLIVNGVINGSLEPIIDEDGETVIGFTEITGAISTSGAGILGGSGFLKGSTSIGGTLAPGTSAGIISFGSELTLTNTGSVVMELGGHIRGSQYDGVNVGGALTLDGGLNIAFLNSFRPSLDDTFTLFTGFTSVAGNFAEVTFSDPLYTGFFDPSAGTVTVTGVPEPGSSALLILGLGAVASRRPKKSPSTSSLS